MKPITPYFKAVLAAAILVVCVIAQAAGGSGLISAEASEVVRANPGKSSDARGRQLAILQSYLFTQPVTVGLDPDAASDPQAESIVRGVKIWSDALPDCPFELAKAGEKPMIVVRFVDSIASGGDV